MKRSVDNKHGKQPLETDTAYVGTSLVLGFGGNRGPDPNWTSEKWVGHFHELRHNGTSLIVRFGEKSGSDTNWTI